MMNSSQKNIPLTINDAINALSPFGGFTSKRMFGGYGFYKEGTIIALFDEGQLYFKSTPTSEPFYQSFGSYPFVYEGKLRPVKMSYWLVPENVLKDHALLQKWITTAYQSALSAQIAKKPSKKTKAFNLGTS